MPERDPHGRDPHAPGAKLDDGKLLAGVCIGDFSNALIEVAKVTTHGAKKYTIGGWLHVPEGRRRYTDAMYRHLLREATGEVLDEDSKLRHFAHVCWNALAVLELSLRERSHEQTVNARRDVPSRQKGKGRRSMR